MMKKQTFETEILDPEIGIDAAFIKIPFDVKTAFGSLRPKVKAVFDGKVVYRGLLVRMQTPYHMLLLRKDVRAELGKNVGDTIQVEIELDIEPRVVEVPELLQKEFYREPEIEQFFLKLSFTHQKEYVNFVTEAKKDETRLHRIEKVLQMLRDKKKGI
jgi:hypothetical protein